jgi:hypothetical protein
MYRQLLFIFTLYLFGHTNFAKAQSSSLSTFKDEEATRFVYKKEWSGGATLNNRGFGAILRYSIIPTNFMKIQFESELVKLKHSKEIKVVNPYYNNSKSYVYGKENVFYPFRTGIGSQFLIFDRAAKDGVEVSATFMGGASWGILKPVYLEVLKDSNNPFEPVLVSEKFNKNLHDERNILGYSGFTKGLNELSVVPGLYLKSGLNFDWGSKDDRIMCIEAGVVVDYFFKEVPIMTEFENIKNQNAFVSLYATVLFGKKY